MNIAEIKAKRDKLESDLFDLVHQFTKETEVIPCEINFEWIGISKKGKRHPANQVINCTVKLRYK